VPEVPKPDDEEPKKTSIAEQRTSQDGYRNNNTDADTKMQVNEDVQTMRSMNTVRNLNDLQQGYNKAEMEYENKVFQYRDESTYVGSVKGEVNRVLEPEEFGTPEIGTGVFNEQTAIHKQWMPMERHHQQYAEAQDLRNQLMTDKTLSAAEKTEIGKKISDLEWQAASNHYESVRTTAKEFNVIKRINDVNIKNGLGDGLSKEAKQIGEWANQVAKGKMDVDTYKKLVTGQFGSEENAMKIVAKGFRITNR
jgi:hypothetical protein